MSKTFRIHVRNCTTMLAILFCILSHFLFISCRRDELYPPDRAVSLGSNLYMELPRKLISLTYDDGPGPGTLELAKYLHSENICATFFVVGDSGPGGGFKNYPLLDSLIYYGQRIGNHTFNHKDLRTLSCSDAQYQIKKDQLFIDPLIHNNLCYFTPPWFGWSSTLAQCTLSDPELNHLRGPIGMTFDTHDYLYRQNGSPDECANKFLNDPSNVRKFRTGVGGIIKMHDFNSYAVKNFALEETKIIVEFLKSRGYTFVSPTLEFSPSKINLGKPGEFSDEQHWATGYFRSIRLADINGDGKADIIGRDAEGVHVALSTGSGFGNEELWSSEFSDNKGWKAPEYSTTLRCADVNGDHKADLIIRSQLGIRVALSIGNGFQASTLWTNYFSDDSTQQWKKEAGYYGTIRSGDVNGDGLADIVARGSGGIYVSLSSSTSFIRPTIWTNEFSDLDIIKWKEVKYSLTFQLADVNGDSKADLIARGPQGILVSLSDGNGFLHSSVWSSSFSDASGCGKDVSYYGAIRLGDVNGDGKADIIARGKDGIHVLLSNGEAFLQDIIWYNVEFTDRSGWKSACYSNTLQCADFNGDRRCDFILRSRYGISGSVAP